MAVQPDRKIVGVGTRDSRNSYTSFVYRRNRDGSLDRSFDGDGRLVRPAAEADARFTDVSVAKRGRIYVSAGQSERTRRPSALLIALKPNGSYARGFGKKGRVRFKVRRGLYSTSFEAVKALKGGKVLAAGVRRGDLFVVRLNRDGSLDRSFASNGRILVDMPGDQRGSYTHRDGMVLSMATKKGKATISVDPLSNVVWPRLVYRINPNGSFDRSLGGDGRRELTSGKIKRAYRSAKGKGAVPFPNFESAATLPNGKTLLVGSTKIEPPPGKRSGILVVRLRRDGSLDRSFAHGGVYVKSLNRPGSTLGHAVMSLPGGKAIVAGEFDSLDYREDRLVLLRLKR